MNDSRRDVNTETGGGVIIALTGHRSTPPAGNTSRHRSGAELLCFSQHSQPSPPSIVAAALNPDTHENASFGQVTEFPHIRAVLPFRDYMHNTRRQHARPLINRSGILNREYSINRVILERQHVRNLESRSLFGSSGLCHSDFESGFSDWIHPIRESRSTLDGLVAAATARGFG
ncbi:hypothetical protein AVEN_8160-1 [Araneus ventricosus]|uniref:Uncharacterized protein n=1 Tax=Araneus ventricosus TaxID=182803 RepID=A0A4Y2MWT5_ARAVE|nr:hypothetical protein AVEN_8160-1 [Araneus ventricosus]